MNNNNQNQGMPQMPFNPAHDNFYNGLRQFLMTHVNQIPGLDQVLHALNKTHVTARAQAQGFRPTQGQPVMPMSPMPGQSFHPETGQLVRPPFMPMSQQQPVATPQANTVGQYMQQIQNLGGRQY